MTVSTQTLASAGDPRIGNVGYWCHEAACKYPDCVAIIDLSTAEPREKDARFRRPHSSLHALEGLYFTAPVGPVVSNTQDGPVQDEHQRVLTPTGEAIPGLFAAGECGSASGHLYMSEGNLAECCIGREIAGANAAAEGRRR